MFDWALNTTLEYSVFHERKRLQRHYCNGKAIYIIDLIAKMVFTRNESKIFFTSSTRTDILICKYVNEQNNVKHEYVNVHD